jgi:hypothetical protein
MGSGRGRRESRPVSDLDLIAETPHVSDTAASFAERSSALNAGASAMSMDSDNAGEANEPRVAVVAR